MPKALPSPVAETKSVADLVRLVMSGRVRIPVYQRDLQWQSDDVLALFDSIYRGFPIGSLLFHQRSAPAKKLELGPLIIHAQEEPAALDVVDGQQRLVALAAGLMRPLPIPTTPDDVYVVYFDPREQKFFSPTRSGEVPDTWVPLPYLSDGSQLVEWAFHWKHGGDEVLRKILFEAGTRIREYKIPAYTVDVAEADAELIGEIFYRVNAGGKRLQWQVIHDALYGGRGNADKPSTLDELSEELASVGMGRLDPQDLLRCLIAFEGEDVTQSFDLLAGTAARALPTMRTMFGFLSSHAGIVHQRLLPRTAPLTILSRFFHLHPEPKARSLELLTRWIWRCFLALDSFDERIFQRHGVSAIDQDEEQSVQRLLAFLPKVEPGPLLPATFDPRTAKSRIALLGMASLEPRSLTTAQPLDVASILESNHDSFRCIVDGAGELSSSAANRIILDGRGIARAELLAADAHVHGDLVFRSHAICAKGREALRTGDHERFLELRAHSLTEAITAFTRRLAGWSRPDRPSIDYILQQSAESSK